MLLAASLNGNQRGKMQNCPKLAEWKVETGFSTTQVKINESSSRG